jgi:hypothetical protein
MGWQVLTHLPARFFVMWATIECGFSLVKKIYDLYVDHSNSLYFASFLPL